MCGPGDKSQSSLVNVGSVDCRNIIIRLVQCFSPFVHLQWGKQKNFS